MSDDVINSIPFPNAEFYDKTLPKSRMKEIDDLLLSHGFNPKDFQWESDVSSKFQRSDVRVSKLVHASNRDNYFKFNSTREGVMFFTRSPGLNSRVEDGQTGDWPPQLTAAREWLVALKAELEPSDATSFGELDELLGLYRRRVLDQDLLNLTAESEEFGNPLAVVMIDIDKFKRVNDTHGHLSGDEVLQFVADAIKRVTGSKGKSYRYGGEELAIILPNYSAEEAAALSERIRKEIEAGAIGVKEIRVTASFGIAQLPTHGTTAEALIEAADDAMYDAKNLGRNLVRISREIEPAQPQRVISRRQPDPSALTDKEIDYILLQYFRYHSAFCPKDESQLIVDEISSDERVTVDLIISCPRCGLMERIDQPL